MNQFAHYILDEFPKIKVKFQNNIQNKEDYYLFEKEWLDCYNYKKQFIFVFDTTKPDHGKDWLNLVFYLQ